MKEKLKRKYKKIRIPLIKYQNKKRRKVWTCEYCMETWDYYKYPTCPSCGEVEDD